MLHLSVESRVFFSVLNGKNMMFMFSVCLYSDVCPAVCFSWQVKCYAGLGLCVLE